MPEEERQKYKKNAQGYIILLKKVNADPSDIKIIEEQIQEKLKQVDQLSYKTDWYILFNIISWQDRLYLKETATGSKTPLTSTALGSTIGAGRKWSNFYYEFNLEGEYAVANSTTSSNGTGYNYLQSSVPVTSLILGPGMYYKAFSDKVFVGIHLPVSYRTGKWDLPAGYEFENDKQLGAGYFFQVKFYIGSIAIQSRLGKIFPNPASHWAIGALYDF